MAVQWWRVGLQVSVVLAGSGLGSGAALAQAAPVAEEGEDSRVAEVVVTAQRTTAVASKTPLALS
eukprot:gene31359-53655_t